MMGAERRGLEEPRTFICSREPVSASPRGKWLPQEGRQQKELPLTGRPLTQESVAFSSQFWWECGQGRMTGGVGGATHSGPNDIIL